MKKLLSIIICLSMLLSAAVIGVTVNAAEELPFTDVPVTWYTEAIASVYSEGIMKGKTETTFDPTAKITRAEVVTAFARVACTAIDTYGKDLPFDDTAPGQWYSESVGWAAASGIVAGRGDGRFSPADNITRAELASILTKFIAYMGVTLPDNAKIDSFKDADTFDSWMTAPIDAVRKNGLMQGTDGKFNPRGNATRAEIAQVIKNLLPDVGRQTVVENGKSDYVIVIDDGNAAAATAAERMVWQIEETCGVTIKVVDDSASPKAKEIVLGTTSRESGISLGTLENDLRTLDGDGYEIAVKGEKVFIDSKTADGLYRGAVNFLNNCTSGDDIRFTPKSAERNPYWPPLANLTFNGNIANGYTIYYPENASENTMIGVNDLVEYIYRASNWRLDTAVGSGKGADKAIIIEEKTVKLSGAGNDLDSFTVKTEDTIIRITGSAERGAMYGCYELLEQIGWRFLTEGNDFLVTADLADEYGYYNVPPLSIEECSPFYNRIIYADTYLSSVDMQNKGRHINGLEYTGGNCHTFDGLDGDASSQFENQPCLSSEEVYQTMLKNVRALLAANPDAKLISVSQNDNTDYCECDGCKADFEKYTKVSGDPIQGGTAGQLIAFVNRLISDIEDDYPNVLVHTFAYTYTQHAPINIVPDEKVVVQLCSIDCCFAHPLAGAESVCKAQNAPFSQDIKEWSELATTLFIWDYNNNFSHRGTPFPNLTYDILAGNMKLFADSNVRGLFLQGNAGMGNNGEFDRVRWYLEAKLSWDPYMSEEEYYTHMKEFMEGFYGDGWENVYKALMLLHTEFEGQHIGVFDNPKERWMSTALSGCIDQIQAYMDTAKLASESKAQFEAVDCSQIQFDYIYLDIHFNKWYKSTDPELKQKSYDYSLALQNKFQKYDVNISDAYPPPELYDFSAPPTSWKELMDVQMFGE